VDILLFVINFSDKHKNCVAAAAYFGLRFKSLEMVPPVQCRVLLQALQAYRTTGVKVRSGSVEELLLFMSSSFYGYRFMSINFKLLSAVN
jgi:hypothetical protein